MKRETQGSLFTSIVDKLSISQRSGVDAFSLGFTVGQIEKVWSGACAAAMFRPPVDDVAARAGITRVIADHYKLETSVVDREIWVYREQARHIITLTLNSEVNSPAYHLARGTLCGIPLEAIDVKFHERQKGK